MIYCPYTDREIRYDQSSAEHIIPLSLGGINSLEIPVDAAFNSTVGSEIDGALANEFFMALRRTEYDARGHSGKEPIAISKRSQYGSDGRVAQVHLHRKHGIRVWDVRDREDKRVVGEIRINATMNLHLPVQFTAKVALAAGYSVYAELFREHVDHSQLRDIMCIDPTTLDPGKDPVELGIDHLTIRVDRWFDELPHNPRSRIRSLRALCSAVKGSVIALFPGTDCFSVGVGILGQYLAMVSVPANTETFPNEGDLAWGHVLAVTQGTLIRCSLVHGLKRWGRQE